MPVFSYSFLLLFVLVLAGVGIPFMAAMNANLGVRLENPPAAVFPLSLVATFSSGMLLVRGGLPRIDDFATVPVQLYLGGTLFVFYLTAITFGAPKVGLGAAVLVVLFGQVASAALIDHLALMGTERRSLTSQRLLGLGVMAIGLALAKS